MIRVLITGAGSYVGESVRKDILAKSKNFEFNANISLSDRQKDMIYAGGLLNYTKHKGN